MGARSSRLLCLAVGKYQKENPIMQNKEHFVALRRIPRSDIPMFNIVVFGGRVDLRISDVGDATIVHPRYLV